MKLAYLVTCLVLASFLIGCSSGSNVELENAHKEIALLKSEIKKLQTEIVAHRKADAEDGIKKVELGMKILENEAEHAAQIEKLQQQLAASKAKSETTVIRESPSTSTARREQCIIVAPGIWTTS